MNRKWQLVAFIPSLRNAAKVSDKGGLPTRASHLLFLFMMVFSSVVAFSQAQVTTPTPGSTLNGSSVTFIWSAAPNASGYWVDVGNVAGGNQYYQSGNLGNVFTTTVNTLPTDGSTVYVTLYS